MADDNKDDGKMGGGAQGPAKSPDSKRAGEEPGPKNTTFGGGQQAKAKKSTNFTGGDSKQDTHK